MPYLAPHPLRAAALSLAMLTAPAFAQTATIPTTADPATPTAPAPTTRPVLRDQRIERIRHEDSASRIDELRVGGETRSISVQPKSSPLPAYDITPPSPARDPATQGQRSWKALEF